MVEYRVDQDDPDRADPASARESAGRSSSPTTTTTAATWSSAPTASSTCCSATAAAADDPHGHGQNPRTLLGKMLRCDVDAAKPTPEVLGKGLRNPWRYTFDRKTGDLYIADVGQNIFEYVHFVPAPPDVRPAQLRLEHRRGETLLPGRDAAARKGFTPAVVEYPHSEGCSITGGYVYRGKALPELAGAYFYSDYCTALLRSFRMKNGKAVDSWDWKTGAGPRIAGRPRWRPSARTRTASSTWSPTPSRSSSWSAAAPTRPPAPQIPESEAHAPPGQAPR